MQKAIVILGPTSTGKTSLAIKIAKQINGAIISVDSRQVYKYMDIGTGKVPVNTDFQITKGTDKWLIDGIEVFLYDLIYPNEDFNVSTFVKIAKEKINQVLKDNKIPIIVGGTGFYIDILLSEQKVFPVAPDIKLRKQLESLSLSQLQQTLLDLDKDKY
ncbi:MAG: tRNA (adenosine(37)-N6)-dimethylallyltransferase MiaA, partial [bacterium]|nr:tRNA (adenosine(37)-N6)-dimethylallyltransferase MiaA [bacterium]